MTQSLASIGAGPFEFPIAGAFSVNREGGATVFRTVDEKRRYTVGYFRNITSLPPGSASAEQIAKLETIVRANWERFAKQEKGHVVRAFKRADVNGVAIFSMATEFLVGTQTQYYVQFSASDGPRSATIFAEGFGSAVTALQELEPLILSVKIANGG